MTSEPLTVEELERAIREWLKDNVGIVQFYETQEPAFAPGIAGEWPPIIASPHSRHGRLKRVETESLVPKLTELIASHSRQLWLEAAPWISVSERLPEPETPVVVLYGKLRTVAEWIPKFHKSDDGAYEGDCDYDAEKDEYFWPEGFYEFHAEGEETCWLLYKENLTHWMPLPKAESTPKPSPATKLKAHEADCPCYGDRFEHAAECSNCECEYGADSREKSKP